SSGFTGMAEAPLSNPRAAPRRRPRPGAGWGSGALADQVRGALADHDARGVGVAARDARHDRAIRDPEALDPAHAELPVDDRHLVDAHLAGADRVVDGRGPEPDLRLELRVGLAMRAGLELLADHMRDLRVLEDLPHEPEAAHQDLHVV